MTCAVCDDSLETGQCQACDGRALQGEPRGPLRVLGMGLFVGAAVAACYVLYWNAYGYALFSGASLGDVFEGGLLPHPLNSFLTVGSSVVLLALGLMALHALVLGRPWPAVGRSTPVLAAGASVALLATVFLGENYGLSPWFAPALALSGAGALMWSTRYQPRPRREPAVAQVAVAGVDAVTPSPYGTVGLPVPGVGMTVLISALFGPFGAIPAYKHAERARQAGQPTSKYWVAFGVTWAASFVLAVLATVAMYGLLFAALASAA